GTTATAIDPPVTHADPAHGRLVVVIDDDPLVLDGMRGVLRSWGCRVVTGASDDDVLAALAHEEGEPDVIVSDYRLAGGATGIQAIERLRDALGIPVPAFLMSGDTAAEVLREAGARGFRLVHKPVLPMELRTILNRLLKSGGPVEGVTGMPRP
ncbi:MAG: response regulator, partial [Alphaproteobacteria bacterium]